VSTSKKEKKRVAKFMQRFNGPYEVTDIHKETSNVTIDVPTQPNAFPMYHTSHIKPYMANDNEKYPSRTLAEPGPIMVDAVEEYTVERIITHQKISRGFQYRVKFMGWGPEQERWIAGKELEDNEALDLYWENNV